MSLTSRDVSRAEAFGRLAGRNGCDLGSCPYEADGSADERLLAARWVRAWLAHGGRITVDFDEGPERSVTNAQGITVTIARRRPPDDAGR